ncbi:DUF1361 domain-containing protein [Mangrovimonas sp. ST2L15]|uniref:DUF1361 domain-containing protein n=1 Tax=Mangrovimonas sp. ST2L15 TaxID=1645916 RepID=UPI0009EB9522|nr:DUF1361 domain-containing protein [Mangrovimonas sp. ST2L15]
MKSFLFKHYSILSQLFLSMGFSIFLLMVRMKLNQSFFLLFMVWNLFLAIIPYAISSYLLSKKQPSKLTVLTGLTLWLLFLPNAPYMITDLLHLKHNATSLIWLDILVITSFALNGLALFFISIFDVKKLLSSILKPVWVQILSITILIATAFGIYLGRFLRYNSWEILHKPGELLLDIGNILLFPKQHTTAWLFTFCFSTFLWFGYKFAGHFLIINRKY